MFNFNFLNNRHKNILINIFNWCFIISTFLIITCSIIFICNNDYLKNYNIFFTISIIILSIFIGSYLIYTTFKFFKFKSKQWNYKVQKINWILIILLVLIVACTVQMNYQTVDGKYCINTARLLSSTLNWQDIPLGNDTYGRYYALVKCYNMAPLIYLQALVFKFFSLIGIKLSFAGMVALGTYANMIMLLIAMYLAFRLIKKYCKVSTQTGFTFLLLINIPLYTTVYYVYTDIPALLSIMIILTAYDSFINSNKFKIKVFLLTIIISVSIIGALFKFNVLIALFAIIIHYLLTHNWKRNIKFILLLLVPTMLGISGIKHAITITSPIPQSELGLPAMNWINMSFSEVKNNGSHSEKYFKHTFKLKKENDNSNQIVNKIEFKEFISDFCHRPQYYFYIMYRKIGATYGTGTYQFNPKNIEDFLANKWAKKLPVGQLIFGKTKNLFVHSSFVLQLSLFLLMGLGTFQLIRRKIYLSPITPWMLTLFGNMFMLLFWESQARYLLPFVGTIYMIACFGIEQVLDTHEQKKLKAKNK